MSHEIIDRFALFAGTDGGIESWLTPKTDPRIFDRLKVIDTDPLGRSQLNQLLLLGHEAALSDGFFRYYWLHTPATQTHPYRLEALEGFSPEYNDRNAIHSIEQLRWGLYRFYADALLFFGNVRQAYRHLRGLSFEAIATLYRTKCFDYDSKAGLVHRGPALPLQQIPRDDRYLISEMACKSFDPISSDSTSMLDALAASYKSLTKSSKRKSFTIKELIKGVAEQDRQYELAFAASEFVDEKIASIAELKKKYGGYKARFDTARNAALENTQTYLSCVNDLDIYVATSMRTRDDFRRMADRCKTVFETELLEKLHLRYFDPTLSAAPGHEDKGLIECLMVKCAKVLVYMAGDKESYGKDAEAAMALSLGKPVIFLCDEEQRSRFYKDVHPLSRLIDFKSGVAVGAFVTSRVDQVPLLLNRIFSNNMEYEIVRPKDDYLQIRDRLTQSIVRVQTNNRLLRETFWNHYHNPV
jgi:hypothetical protein